MIFFTTLIIQSIISGQPRRQSWLWLYELWQLVLGLSQCLSNNDSRFMGKFVSNCASCNWPCACRFLRCKHFYGFFLLNQCNHLHYTHVLWWTLAFPRRASSEVSWKTAQMTNFIIMLYRNWNTVWCFHNVIHN